jgi:hypothetical protein
MRVALTDVLKVKVFGPMIGGWYGVTEDSTPADNLASAHVHPAFELQAHPVSPLD